MNLLPNSCDFGNFLYMLDNPTKVFQGISDIYDLGKQDPSHFLLEVEELK